MKENEAIAYLKNRYLAVGSRVNGGEKGIKMCKQHNEAIDMAINALQEIQIYRTSEAVARRTNAMRKQQAIAPVFIGGDFQRTVSGMRKTSMYSILPGLRTKNKMVN